MVPEFCSSFDAALFAAGPPAVFLPDREGMLRFDETWTRDAWARAVDPARGPAVWRLLRDRATGFVTLVVTTSAELLIDHPRADVRAFGSYDEAVEARAAFGSPPIAREAW